MRDGGHTFVRTFSKEGGETIEKHSKNTSVWGYDNGRKRLLRVSRHLASFLPIQNGAFLGSKRDMSRRPPLDIFPDILNGVTLPAVAAQSARCTSQIRMGQRLTRSLLDPQYPTSPNSPACHPPRPGSNSCRIRSGRIPLGTRWWCTRSTGMSAY